jgi:hypothetical protein
VKRDPSPGAAQQMAQGDGAVVRVHGLRVEAEGAHAGQRLVCERPRSAAPRPGRSSTIPLGPGWRTAPDEGCPAFDAVTGEEIARRPRGASRHPCASQVVPGRPRAREIPSAAMRTAWASRWAWSGGGTGLPPHRDRWPPSLRARDGPSVRHRRGAREIGSRNRLRRRTSARHRWPRRRRPVHHRLVRRRRRRRAARRAEGEQSLAETGAVGRHSAAET